MGVVIRLCDWVSDLKKERGKRLPHRFPLFSRRMQGAY
jgi:hypothetical protein